MNLDCKWIFQKGFVSYMKSGCYGYNGLSTSLVYFRIERMGIVQLLNKAYNVDCIVQKKRKAKE